MSCVAWGIGRSEREYERGGRLNADGWGWKERDGLV